MEKLLKKILWVAVISLFIISVTSYVCVLKSDVDVPQEKELGANMINAFYEVNATTTTTVAGNPKVILDNNTSRKYAVITNTTATIAYLAFNGTSTLNSITDKEYVVPLAASGGTYTINLDNLYRGQVVASSSGAVTIRALEAN